MRSLLLWATVVLAAPLASAQAPYGNAPGFFLSLDRFNGSVSGRPLFSDEVGGNIGYRFSERVDASVGVYALRSVFVGAGEDGQVPVQATALVPRIGYTVPLAAHTGIRTEAFAALPIRRSEALASVGRSGGVETTLFHRIPISRGLELQPSLSAYAHVGEALAVRTESQHAEPSGFAQVGMRFGLPITVGEQGGLRVTLEPSFGLGYGTGGLTLDDAVGGAGGWRGILTPSLRLRLNF